MFLLLCGSTMVVALVEFKIFLANNQCPTHYYISKNFTI